MERLTIQLKRARPKLYKQAPFLSVVIVLFGLLNITFGVAFMINIARPATLIVINPVVTLQVWGLLFGLLGVAMIVFLAMNNWRWSRYVLILTLFIKTVWLFALMVRAADGLVLNHILLIVWSFLWSIQLFTYIYFPKYKKVYGDV